MTKAPLGGEKCGPNPTDRAKNGVKRSLLTEANGVPIGLAVDGANRNDFKMMKTTLESIPLKRPKPTRKNPQGLCLDKGYDYDEARDLAREFWHTAHIRTRGEEAQALKREAGIRTQRRRNSSSCPMLENGLTYPLDRRTSAQSRCRNLPERPAIIP